ncbi:MAG: lycopene cyclase domain-containing protein [Verrucomicrobiia bacterium]
MTYLQFHFLFILPPIALLAVMVRHRIRAAHLACLGLVAFIAVAFALPWDHAAVARGIWGFDEAKVLVRIWLLPVEEIAFFVFETLLVGLLCILYLPSIPRGK